MHKPEVADGDFLMFVEEQYLHHRKLLVIKDFVVKNMILEKLEAFVKKLNAGVAAWDLGLCSWLKRGCITKS